MSLYDRTGDSVAFFDWLASNTTQVRVPVRLKWVDEDLYDLIQNKYLIPTAIYLRPILRLLVKRTTERASVLECLEHPFCIKRFEIPASDSAAKSYIFDLFEGNHTQLSPLRSMVFRPSGRQPHCLRGRQSTFTHFSPL